MRQTVHIQQIHKNGISIMWIVVDGRRIPVLPSLDGTVRFIDNVEDSLLFCDLLSAIMMARRANTYPSGGVSEKTATSTEELMVVGDSNGLIPDAWSIIVFSDSNIDDSHYQWSVDMARGWVQLMMSRSKS